VRQILFGADVARLDGRDAELERRVEQGLAELERRMEARLTDLSQRLAAQLDELSRRQQAHADRVTQLLDQVMAELTRRGEALSAESRSGMEEMRAKLAELERRKLNVADFGASLATLGQRFAAAAAEDARGG
jgi:DNA anti-recombination protein RmuC